LLSGCASLNNLSFLNYKDQPDVRIEKSPLLNNRAYAAVCAIPITRVKSNPWSSGITQSQISSFVVNAFNTQGYVVVNDISQADLAIAVDAITQDTSFYIPPFQYQVPKYVPPQTIDINSNQYGNFYGGMGYPRSNFSGYYYGNSQTQVTLPGYTTTQTMLYPGQFVKQFGYTVQLFIYDNKTGDCVYSAAGYATSGVKDIRIGSQMLLANCMSQFPSCGSPYWAKELYKDKFYPGISYISLTIDGNNYFPTVLGLKNKSAEKAGLRDRDIITAVNGQSVVNMFDEQVFQLLCSDSKGGVTATIYRNGKTMDLTLPLENTVQQFFNLR
jgi:hypothetical protein